MKPVEDPAGWSSEHLERDQSWIIELTPAEIGELDTAVHRSRGTEIGAITRENFRLPTLDKRLAEVRSALLDGRGLAVLRGVPVERYSIQEAAAAFWAIGLRIGVPVSQNRKGHLLGHVVDLTGKSRQAEGARGYNTSAGLGFHTDSCDVVGLLCLQQSKSGGESLVVSTVTVYNEILRRRPDLLEELIRPWPCDRVDEVPPGKQAWFHAPVFNFCDGHLTAMVYPTYMRTSQRFAELPRYTERQLEALDFLDLIAGELASKMTFERGDIQLLHSHVTAHARTEYQDWPEPGRRRHLLRLWLATPGGRPLPDFMLDRYVGLKAGDRPCGIQVANMTLGTPLQPE